MSFFVCLDKFRKFLDLDKVSFNDFLLIRDFNAPEPVNVQCRQVFRGRLFIDIDERRARRTVADRRRITAVIDFCRPETLDR